MISRRRRELALAIYVQTRGFAFVLFEGWLSPVDWAVQDIRGANKKARCLQRIDALFALHTPDVVVLQEMADKESRRAIRIQKLTGDIAGLAESRSIAVRMYLRTELRETFSDDFGATTKQGIAEAIAKEIPALGLFVPPARKPWMSEHARMGIFEAAALAWMYFHEKNGGQQGRLANGQ
jgi:hypothetical protein